MTSTEARDASGTDRTAGDGDEGRLADLVTQLSLEEKVRLLTGDSAWSTAAAPSIGLRSMVLSDGPSGVRGATWDERDPSACLPSATALSSSWDLDVARRYGAVSAAEARRKGVDVILGPTVNLHRSPLGGRHFEAFSEDPLLTGDLAAAYVEGAQANGVGATLKHYVANDFETDRFNADVRVDDRALRELYLLAFEPGVTEAGAWLVMSAYNSINGTTATENALLQEPLTGEWGFDGVIVSDWTAVRSLESARTPQDLAMPGPDGPWGPKLVAAVEAGDIDEALIDLKVQRILRLAARVGALEGFDAPSVPDSPPADTFAREAAAEGMVLVENDGILPVDRDALTRIAVIGYHASHPRIQGGGSATVVPPYVVSPLQGLRDAFPAHVSVEYEPGVIVQARFTELGPDRMRNPSTGGPGARLTAYGPDGTALYSEDRFGSFILDFGRDDLDADRASLSFATNYNPEMTGELRLGFAGPGHGRLTVDGRLVLDATVAGDSDQVQDFFAPPAVSAGVQVEAGRPLDLVFEFWPGGIVDGVPGSLAVTFGTEAQEPSAVAEEERIQRAVAAARAADVAVVVVGTHADVECEGYDRADLRLPGAQDRLMSAVAAANPRTIAVVNAGAPVEMPWRHEVAAVLLTWFGGQEYGNALADVLVGLREPGGRLPTTWPARLADVPVVDVTPKDGVVVYQEGIHIGYRAWVRAQRRPAYPFGAGLGYTSWEVEDIQVTVSADRASVAVAARMRNTGQRAGKTVLQVYAQRPESEIERPDLWLVGFGVVRADAGERAEISIEIPARRFAHWAGEWTLEGGLFGLLVGTSSQALSEPIPFAFR